MKYHLANIVTGLRLLSSIPIFIYIVFSRLDMALVLYVLALFSDLVDGYVARRINCCSATGAFLDVSADFIIVVAGVSGFVILGEINVLVLVLVLLTFGQFIFGFGGEIVYDPFGKLFGIIMLCSVPFVMMGSTFVLFVVNYLTLYLGLCSFIGRVIYLKVILGVNFSIETPEFGVLSDRDR